MVDVRTPPDSPDRSGAADAEEADDTALASTPVSEPQSPPATEPAAPPVVVSSRRKVPSAKPALVVLGIAAFLVLLFGIGGALNGGTSAPPKPSVVTGAGLASEPASTVMRPVLMADTPPQDILRALVVPTGTLLTGEQKWDGSTQFSATVHLQADDDQASLATFFKAELHGRGWDVISTGPADHDAQADQVLATKASNDGWYWEVGVTVKPSTFAAGSTTDQSAFTIELYEVADAT